MKRKEEINCCIKIIINDISDYDNRPQTYDGLNTLKEKSNKLIEEIEPLALRYAIYETTKCTTSPKNFSIQ